MISRIIFFLSLLSGNLFSQVFNGVVLDKNSLKPVPECLVIIKGSTTSNITGLKGDFTLPFSPQDQKATLVFTILGYTTIEYPLTEYKKDTFYITSKNVLLKEVVVAADKKNILNPESQETVLDFDLLNDNLIVLTAGMGKNNLRLMDEHGKTISGLRVNRSTESLKHDCIGNLQLSSNDSTWQIFYDYIKLNELKPFSSTLYNQVIGHCVCSDNKTYYFQSMRYRNLKTEYFYYKENEKGVRHELVKFQDTAKIRSFELDYNLQYFLDVRRKSKYTMYNESVDEIKRKIDQYREALPLDWAYASWLGKIKTQMVKKDTDLFLINFTDSVIYSISKNNHVKLSSGFSALHNKNIQPTIYVDADYKETYLMQFSDNKLTAIKFDIDTGKELSKTDIPNIPYLPKKIIINGGKAYFIQKNLADGQPYKIIKYYLD